MQLGEKSKNAMTSHGEVVLPAAVICYTLHTMLHITGAHGDKVLGATVTSHTLYIMLHVTASHGDMVSKVAMISHTLYMMLHITISHVYLYFSDMTLFLLFHT